MATEVKLPELGENITSATVLDVLVKEGDAVEKDQPILSLESDKAEFDLPSPAAGKVAEVLVKKGDAVEVGQVVLRLDGAGAGAASKEGREEVAPKQSRAQAREPETERDSAKEATPRRSATDGARKREPEREERRTAKGERREERPAADEREPQRRRQKGDDAEREAEAEEGEPETAEPAPRESEEGEPDKAEPDQGAQRMVAAAPSVRRLARELGIEIASVTGSGPQGRVSAEDVYRHVRRKLAALEGDAGRAKGEAGRDYSRWGEVHVEQMSTVRRRTAEQMSLAWSSIPHVTHHDAADITELDRLRGQFAPRVERAGGKLTITAVLLKVVGSALRRYPKFNASIDMERAEILYKEFVNVGVAVDTERGLLVPVIRAVDTKNILELALELHEVSEAARTRKIRPDMLQGATFTVTNLGGIGGTHFNPLINPPEVAVLGVSRGGMKQVWVDGKFEPHLMLPLSVSYDHRLIDGADAARFLRWVCEALEEPFLMDLEGD